MADESRNPVVDMGRLRLEKDDEMRDNMLAILDAIGKIEKILIDFDNRLKELE